MESVKPIFRILCLGIVGCRKIKAVIADSVVNHTDISGKIGRAGGTVRVVKK